MRRASRWDWPVGCPYRWVSIRLMCLRPRYLSILILFSFFFFLSSYLHDVDDGIRPIKHTLVGVVDVRVDDRRDVDVVYVDGDVHRIWWSILKRRIIKKKIKLISKESAVLLSHFSSSFLSSSLFTWSRTIKVKTANASPYLSAGGV